MKKTPLLILLTFLFINSFGQYGFTSSILELPKQINSNVDIRPSCCGSLSIKSFEQNSNVVTRFRCYASPSVNQPLYIIDGLISDSSALKFLTPKDILRIDILKGAKATALYGYQAEAGAIIISTKRSMRLIIEDEDKHSIPAGATVKVTSDNSEKDSLLLITNQKGEIDLSSLNDNKKYKAEISCIGYKSKTVSITSKSNFLVQLEKDYKNLKEITIVSYPAIHCKSLCVCYCTFLKSSPSNEEELPLNNNFSIFPNPAFKFGTITIKLLHSFNGEVEIINSASQVVQKIKMSSDVSSYEGIALNIITAGVYFIRCTDVHLQKLFTQKLIVQ